MKTVCLILLIFLFIAENLGATDDCKKYVKDIKNYVKCRTPAWMHQGAPFSLSKESPALEGGTFIGMIKSPGPKKSGKKLKIKGIRFIEGDAIKTEHLQEAIVVYVYPSGNTIELDREISWTKGEGIHFWFEGKRPNIGASLFLPPK